MTSSQFFDYQCERQAEAETRRQERGGPPCPSCGGRGYVPDEPPGDPSVAVMCRTCRDCGGDGTV